MELRQLRYFLGVCEAGSFLKASVRLHVAQPALGHQMSTLEEELGVRLLLRSNKGVTPTSAGKTTRSGSYTTSGSAVGSPRSSWVR